MSATFATKSAQICACLYLKASLSKPAVIGSLLILLEFEVYKLCQKWWLIYSASLSINCVELLWGNY